MRGKLRCLVAVVAVLGCGGCQQSREVPAGATSPVWDVRPAGVEDPATIPVAPEEATGCGDPRESLRPTGPLPRPGLMPPGSAMERIVQRGTLVAGVNLNAYRVGYRDPITGQLAGFEIDVVRAISSALFGDPDRVRYKAISQANRVAMLNNGQIDIAVRTTTMTCANWEEAAFSTEYYTANQRLLVRAGDEATEIEHLNGRKVCAATGSTSIANIRTFNPAAIPVSAPDVVDCLVMLQQRQIDAISTSDILLMALAEQDPNTAVVGRPLKQQPYGVSVAPSNEDLVRFVNGVLETIRANGTWTAAYTRWLAPILGAPPPPPVARYRS